MHKNKGVFGFSLIEISVVLSIIGVLLSCTFFILPIAIGTAQYNETVRRMDFINDTIKNYAVTFGRLPCPSNLTTISTDVNYGKEAVSDGQTCSTVSIPSSWSQVASENNSFTLTSTSLVRYGTGTSWNYLTLSGTQSCSNGVFGDPAPGYFKECDIGSGAEPTANFSSTSSVEGGLPVRTLKIPDKFIYDAWGKRFRYAANGPYTIAKSTAGMGSAAICGSPSALTINDAAGGRRSSSAAYVLLSHGSNGHGGYTSAGIPSNYSSTNVDELQNCHCDNSASSTVYDGTYVEKLPTENVGNLTDHFDDIVTFREAYQLASNNRQSTQCLTIKGIYVSGQDKTAFVDNVQFIPSTGFVNPGFESPMLYQSQFYYGSMPGWDDNGQGVTNNASGFTGSNDNAPDGYQVAFLQGAGGVLSQTITTFQGNYSLHFYASNRMNSGGNPEDFNVVVDGTIIAHYTVSTGSYSAFITPSFPLAAGTHSVSFHALNSGAYSDVAVFIDDVALVADGANLNALDSLNLALDGSFETPQIVSGTVSQPSQSSWHFFQSYIGANGSPYGNPDAPVGNQQAIIQNDGSISHAVALPPGSYQLKFLTLNRVYGDQQTLNIYLNDKLIGTVNPYKPSSTSYNYYNQYITDPFVVQ